MLVEVLLHGELGKKFGRKWELAAKSPNHAFRLINANTGTLLSWLREKASKYTLYRVVCEYQDGSKKVLSEQDYEMQQHKPLKRIRFTPVIVGAGGDGGLINVIIGVALIVVGIFTNPALIFMGASMLFGGISQMLAPKKKLGDRRTSHYFNGTEQTYQQGAPVQLIYGRCLVSGQPISVESSIDQVLYEQRNSADESLEYVAPPELTGYKRWLQF